MSEHTSPGKGNFLVGGGIMGELIRSKNWAATPLGPIETWPQSLRTTVSLCLASNFPINLIWGPQHIQIYNDGYRPICAGKHPRSLGEDYTKTWASAWEILDDAFTRALAGQTSFLENQRMFLDRNGYLEETFFTFSLSPIRDESGDIGGLFHPVTETTPQMLSQRRTRALQDLSSRAGHARSVKEACQLAVEALSEFQLDLPFALIYLVDEEASAANLAATACLQSGSSISPERIELNGRADSPWQLNNAFHGGATIVLNGVAPLFSSWSCGPYPEPPGIALVVPIGSARMEKATGFLVAGISPRLPFTPEYRAFVDLVGATLAASIVSARAYEEERKRAEKLAELDRAKTDFFSNVSHEFRTPLTLMLGPLEDLLAHPEEQIMARREVVDLIHRNSLRLLRLVNNLLDFARIEANRVQALYEPIDLATYTSDLASSFRAAIEKAGLVLEVDCPSLSQAVYVDREMWEKIILNLLSNALKFTFTGRIRVQIKESDQHIHTSVSDTGTGIPDEEIPKLFQRFHRVQGTKGRTYEGTGIGLALVDDLVKLHGGLVWAESKLGQGTAFHITLPKGSKHLPAEHISPGFKPAQRREASGRAFIEEAIQWLPAHAETGSATLEVSSNKKLKRIVLADDNADMRSYICNILETAFEVEPAEDGAKALKIILGRPPDLVLTDVMMPDLDGFGLLKALRSHEQTQGIPIVMLSARAGEEARAEGIEAGADDYLVKPFKARELVARVRVNLELSDLRRKLAREEEKLRGAAEIERQRRLFDTALSHTPDAIYIFDVDSRVIYANRSLLDRWQAPLSAVTGKYLKELGYPVEVATKLESQIKSVVQQRLPIHDQTSLLNADETRYYDYVLVPVFSESGTVEAVAGSTRDITDFQEANRALREANSDLEQFAYSASHDLQEPLRMVAIFSQLLQKNYGGRLDADADAIIRQCVDGAVRMEQLIRDLLAYTRVAVVPVEAPRCVSLDEVFEATLESLRMSISETKASITRSSLPVVRAEPVHLRQIFQNLVGNALKYHSARSPVIAVGAREDAGMWIISVADNGIGIPDAHKDQIFGLFKRLHNRERYAGTGLGLAICKKLVERYGGKIWVESESGQGSTFFFTFPTEGNERVTQNGNLQCSTV